MIGLGSPLILMKFGSGPALSHLPKLDVVHTTPLVLVSACHAVIIMIILCPPLQRASRLSQLSSSMRARLSSALQQSCTWPPLGAKQLHGLPGAASAYNPDP